MSKWLGAVDAATAERSADGVSDARAGFESSSFRVTLTIGDQTLELTLGGPAPAPSGARYAKVESAAGSLVCVVRGSIASELEVAFESFREARMLEYGSASSPSHLEAER